jgi:hypothetical protein
MAAHALWHASMVQGWREGCMLRVMDYCMCAVVTVDIIDMRLTSPPLRLLPPLRRAMVR